MRRPSFSIYDASAGSGKTYTLVKEYLKILFSSNKNDAYKNILAITFTNKAVHEMKSRIVNSLSELAKDEVGPKSKNIMKDLMCDVAMTEQQVRDKARAIIKHIIHNYAAFDISTIDKFTHKVIRTFALDLDLPVNFEVSLDTSGLLTEAVDALISQAGEDPQLTRLLVDFTMEKTDDDKSWDVSQEIFNTGRLLLNENDRKEILNFDHVSLEDFSEIKKRLHLKVKDINEFCAQTASSLLKLIDDRGIERASFSGQFFIKHCGYIETDTLKSTHKRFYEPEDIKVLKNSKDADAIESIKSELLAGLSDVYKKYQERDFLKAYLKNIIPLSLLSTIKVELDKVQKEQNVLSIAEFNKLINDEIQNQPAPFIYERMGERYKHFFIDEFQDTSEMQWLNLIPLIDNATSSEDLSGERGTLMIVGDPKQSIYRFRGGKAEQFIKLVKKENPFSNPEVEVIPLGINYRSHEQVVTFNNAFFAFMAHQFDNPEYKDLYENHSAQACNEKEGGFVEISFIPEIEEESDEETTTKTDLYLELVLEKITSCQKQGFEYKDIVILTRRRKEGIFIANFLTEKSIPILSSETLMIANASEVQFLILVLRYLQNKDDRDSKARMLYHISESFETNLEKHDFIAAGLSKEDENELQKWLFNFGINLSFADLRQQSLYDIVEILVSKLIPGNTSNAYIQYFQDLVLEKDVIRQTGISDFLIYWDTNSHTLSIPSPEGNNAIRIMTIHKAKGLEFPVVIYPFAEEDFNRSIKGKFWIDADETIFGASKVLLDESKALMDMGDVAAEVYSQKIQEQKLDIINVLYVALTRAGEQLYVISNMNKKKDGSFPENLSTYFVEYLENKKVFDPDIYSYSFGKQEKISEPSPETEKNKDIKLVDFPLQSSAIKIAQREALMWGSQQQDAIEYGNTIHEILALIKVKEDMPLAIEKSLESGLITSSQKEIVQNTIQEILNNEELLEFFNADYKVLNEHAIIQKEGATVKPDRVVLKSRNEAMILDYKTGVFQESHRRQIEQYQHALEKMGYSISKKTLLYIGKDLKVLDL
ncbi:MAG: UvrD-helicase domain-containing protein [Flavobacterium sp.]